MQTISITQLNTLLGNKYEAYALINKDYLPAYSSKAITTKYLTFYLFGSGMNPQIFMILRKNLKFETLPPTREGFSVPELLDRLETLLALKELPLTGLNLQTLPDRDWILRVLRYVDETNDSNVFGSHTDLDSLVTRQINPM